MLYGGMVGGPLPSDKFWDWRDDWVQTEIALDYNAAIPFLASWQVSGLAAISERDIILKHTLTAAAQQFERSVLRQCLCRQLLRPKWPALRRCAALWRFRWRSFKGCAGRYCDWSHIGRRSDRRRDLLLEEEANCGLVAERIRAPGGMKIEVVLITKNTRSSRLADSGHASEFSLMIF